jgi:hypothetical protein
MASNPACWSRIRGLSHSIVSPTKNTRLLPALVLGSRNGPAATCKKMEQREANPPCVRVQGSGAITTAHCKTAVEGDAQPVPVVRKKRCSPVNDSLEVGMGLTRTPKDNSVAFFALLVLPVGVTWPLFDLQVCGDLDELHVWRRVGT